MKKLVAKVDLLIKNGNVVFPKEGVRKVNIGVDGENLVLHFRSGNEGGSE